MIIILAGQGAALEVPQLHHHVQARREDTVDRYAALRRALTAAARVGETPDQRQMTLTVPSRLTGEA